MHESHLQFVVLRHVRAKDVHWDLCLEVGEVLATWQILAEPERLMSSGDALAARKIGDHRRIYLDYEGPISGGRGEVVRFDRGTWEHLEAGIGRRRFRLEGQRLKGEFVLERLSAEGDAWRIRRVSGEMETGAHRAGK